LVIGLFLLGGHALRGASVTQTSPRERISINGNWRFTKGDPGEGASLLYDVRPPGPKSGAGARAMEANAGTEETAASNSPPAVIKAWILPTGNDFLKDPARRFARPDGNPG